MAVDQNRGKANEEPIEDGLSALKRLAALDKAGSGAGGQARSSQTAGAEEAIPDWLELLLAKYGEQASMLVGIRPGSSQLIDLADSQRMSEESSKVASLLEQMAAETEISPPTERPETSVDWGKPESIEDEVIEDQASDWLNRLARPSPPPPPVPVDEEAPDWLSEISELRPEVETPAEQPESDDYSLDEEEVPEWLQELPPPPQPSVTPKTREPASPEPISPEGEVPDWLKDLDFEVTQAEEAPPAPEGEVPDWLKELGVTTPGVEPSEAEETLEGEAPDWLRRLGVEAPQAEETFLPPDRGAEKPPDISGQEDVEGEVPGWLARLADMSAREGGGQVPPALETPSSAREEEVPAEEPGPAAEAGLPELDLSKLEREPPSRATYPPGPSEGEVEAVESLPPEAHDEVPDWLRELEADVGLSESAAETPVAPEPEIPDWLREMELAEETPSPRDVQPLEPPPSRPPESLPVEPAAEAPIEPEPEIPDWLASLRGEELPPLPMEEEEAPSEEYLREEVAEEPDWLAALRVTRKPDILALDEEVVESEEEVLPDWLAELRASQAPTEMPPGAPEILEEAAQDLEVEEEEGELVEFMPTEIETEVPDWLAELPGAEYAEAEEAKPPSVEAERPVGEEGGPLDWLAEIEAAAEVAEYAEAEVAPAEAEAPPSAEEEAIPEWLRQMPPVEPPGEAEVPEIEEAGIESPPPSPWLVEESTPGPYEGEVSELTQEVPVGEEAPPGFEGATQAEVPDWLLQFEPEAEETVEYPEEEPAESGGVLAGISGLLPIPEEEMAGEEEPVAVLRSRLGVPEVPDVEGAKLFKEITSERPRVSLQELGKAEEAEAGPEPESRRGRIVATLAWVLIFITLIAAIALALLAVLDRVGDLLGGPAFREFFGSPLVIDPAPVNTFRAQVTRLPSDAVVVVSFDYSPATEAEMGPLAEIILRDLLEHQVRVIAVSLRPEGPAMAQRLLNRFESEYPYGERTLNLGYLPGQTAGVRSLAFLPSMPLFENWARTVKDYPAWQDVGGLGDVALIVAVADTPLAVRWWVEQVGPGTLADRPMVAAVSTAADPTVRPYYNQIDPKSGQLLGLISGITGAAAYENRLRQPGRGVQSLAAQSVAHLGLVVLSLGGTIMGFRTQAIRESGHQGIQDHE